MTAKIDFFARHAREATTGIPRSKRYPRPLAFNTTNKLELWKHFWSQENQLINMKYIKNNKVYDTENSIHFGSYTDLNSKHFCWLTETLYRTWGGTFYLIREGYSLISKENREESSQSSSSGLMSISILSEDEAKKWYKKYQM